MRADPKARFQALYESTSRNVYAYLRRHCDQDLAETVTSEVYLKAWRHFDELDAHPIGWLLAVARTTLLDHYRSRARRSRLTDDFFTVTRGRSQAGPETTVLERQAMLTALTRLSEEDREALLLVGWDGLSHSSAARVLGCSSHAFTKRLSRARQRFEESLDPRDEISRRPIVSKELS